MTLSEEARRSYAEFICDLCNLRAYADRMAEDGPAGSAAIASLQRPHARGKGATAAPRPRGFLNFVRGVIRAGGRPSAIPWIAAAACAAVAVVIVLWNRDSEVRPQIKTQQAALQERIGQGSQQGGNAAAAANNDGVQQKNERARPAPLVARLERAGDCLWAGAATALRQGDALAAGSRLELLSGTAEISFLDLAHVTLQGPATLEIESSTSARLESGKATVNNPAAANFKFVTPGMVFSLASAEFAVELKPDGTEQISVISGNVAAAKIAPGARIYKNSPGGGPQTAEAGPGTMILTANQPPRVIEAPVVPSPGGAPSDFPRWKSASAKLARDRALIAYYDFQRDESASNGPPQPRGHRRQARRPRRRSGVGPRPLARQRRACTSAARENASARTSRESSRLRPRPRGSICRA